MLKLAIFDYDGLLVESEHIARKAEEKILKKYGLELSDELFNSYLGFSVRDTIKGYIEHFKLTLPLQDFLDERDEYLYAILESELSLKPGVMELLNYFDQNAIRSVIASSGTREYVEKGLEYMHLTERFANITTVSEVKNGKPNPDLFLKALEKNATNAEHAIVFEDAVSGVSAAKKAGIFCIAIPSGDIDTKLYKHADVIMPDLGKVIELYKNGIMD